MSHKENSKKIYNLKTFKAFIHYSIFQKKKICLIQNNLKAITIVM